MTPGSGGGGEDDLEGVDPPAGLPAIRLVLWNACSLLGGAGTTRKLERVGLYYGKHDDVLVKVARCRGGAVAALLPPGPHLLLIGGPG